MISRLPRIGDLSKRRKKTAEDGSIVVDAARKATGGKARTRIVMTMAVFFTLYSTIAGRLVYLGLQDPDLSDGPQSRVTASRPDIVDRNGEVLATDIKTASLFAEPRRIVDADEAIEKLSTVLPEIDYEQTYRKLKSGAGFVWLQRQLTPKQQADIMALGVPGLGFRTEKRRFYPSGETSSYIVGLTNIDNQGISGMEKYIDEQGLSDLQASGLAVAKDLKPVRLSIDLRVQHVVRDEIAAGLERYRAVGAGAVVLNIKTGEVVAMASVPDFDPNNPYNAQDKDRLNRMSAGLYEMGSTFKSFTSAMALDSGKATMNSRFDASHPIRVGHQAIHDSTARTACCRCQRCSSIHPTSAQPGRRSSSASRDTANSCIALAFLTGCRPNCRRSRARPSQRSGNRSIRSPLPSATACRRRRCRPPSVARR